MSEVNLLPPEFRRAQNTRRLTSRIVLAALAAMVLVVLFFFMQLSSLSDARSDLEAQQQENADLQNQIAGLQEFADLDAELAQKQQLVTEVYANEISWSSVLLDISRIIPDASYLTNMSASIQAGVVEGGVGPTGATGSDGTLVGAVAFDGLALETETVSMWLTRLGEIAGWVNPWVTSAQETAPRSSVYTFSSGVDLSTEALTERGRGVAP